MIRRPPRSTLSSSSAASDVYKRQADYRAWLDTQEWNPGIGLSRERWDVHAVFLPELAIDLEGESVRLRGVMDELGNVNIFLSEGAGIAEIVAQLEASGQE